MPASPALNTSLKTERAASIHKPLTLTLSLIIQDVLPFVLQIGLFGYFLVLNSK